MCFSLDICWTTYCIITLTLYKGLKYTIKIEKKKKLWYTELLNCPDGPSDRERMEEKR